LAFLWIISSLCLAQSDLLFLRQQPTPVNPIDLEFNGYSIRYRNASDNSVMTVVKDNIDTIKLRSPQEGSDVYQTKDLRHAFEKGLELPIVWFGIDFTHVTVCHPANSAKYSHMFFKDCNDFVLQDKHYKPLWIRKKSRPLSGLKQDLTVVTERNKKVNLDQVFDCRDSAKRVPLHMIRENIQTYRSEKFKKGIGLVFLMAEIDKRTESEVSYMVLFDIHSREILFVKRVFGAASGMTMAWHWTYPILNAIMIYNQDWRMDKWMGLFY